LNSNGARLIWLELGKVKEPEEKEVGNMIRKVMSLACDEMN
jgi:hypothetical protein